VNSLQKVVLFYCQDPESASQGLRHYRRNLRRVESRGIAAIFGCK
jgi:hypothetical protein